MWIGMLSRGWDAVSLVLSVRGPMCERVQCCLGWRNEKIELQDSAFEADEGESEINHGTIGCHTSDEPATISLAAGLALAGPCVYQPLTKPSPNQVRTDINYPVGFMDVISIEKSDEHFRLMYDAKGRFVLHRCVSRRFLFFPE